MERRCSASTAIAQPLPIACLRRAECSAAIAVEESKRSAPAVARSLDRRASCELLSRCQLPVTRECAAAPAWRLHRRTDAFAFATNTAGLCTSAPAIWPRVAPADCPLPKGAMLFSTFLSTYKKWSTWSAVCTHWAGPTEVALQTLLGAAHTPASDRQGLYITVLTYTRDTLSGRHALRPTIDVPTRSGTPNAPRDTCARPRVHTHNGRKPARVHQRGPN